MRKKYKKGIDNVKTLNNYNTSLAKLTETITSNLSNTTQLNNSLLNINEELKIHNIEPKFVDGVRFTDDKTMEIAEMVLSGKVNKNLVAEANNQGLYAVGISGKDANFIQAKKKNKLGNVGEIVSVDTKIINTLLESGFIPVISPVCCDDNCKSLNVNADDVAVEVAKALKAEKLVFLTDIDGVFQDVNDKNSLISVILTKDI